MAASPPATSPPTIPGGGVLETLTLEVAVLVVVEEDDDVVGGCVLEGSGRDDSIAFFARDTLNLPRSYGNNLAIRFTIPYQYNTKTS